MTPSLTSILHTIVRFNAHRQTRQFHKPQLRCPWLSQRDSIYLSLTLDSSELVVSYCIFRDEGCNDKVACSLDIWITCLSESEQYTNDLIWKRQSKKVKMSKLERNYVQNVNLPKKRLKMSESKSETARGMYLFPKWEACIYKN